MAAEKNIRALSVPDRELLQALTAVAAECDLSTVDRFDKVTIRSNSE
jgi:hypothetical protein